MGSLGKYLFSVICAAVICAIVNSVIHKNSTYAQAVRFLSGLFLTVTVLSPLRSFRLDGLSSFVNTFSVDGEYYTDLGAADAKSAAEAIIKERLEAYILDKAISMGLEIEVEVTLADSDPPVPRQVELRGSAAPYARKKLGDFIANNLAIPEDDQKWN